MAHDYTAALQAEYDAEMAEYESTLTKLKGEERARAESREPDITTSKRVPASEVNKAAKDKAALVAYCMNSGDWSVYYAAFPGEPLPIQLLNDAEYLGYFGHERGR